MIGQLSRLTASAARRRADEMLERFSLTEAAGRAVKTYSGGMRRRLDLAASLIGYPSVLFLDEPTTGLDPNARAMTWEIVRELADGGTTLLLTTQYLDEADQLARRVAVIDGGTVIAEGTPDQLKSSIGRRAPRDRPGRGGGRRGGDRRGQAVRDRQRPAGRGRAAPVGAGRGGRGADHAGRARARRRRGPGQRRDHCSARRSTTCSSPSPATSAAPKTTGRRARRKGVRRHERHHGGTRTGKGRHLRAQPALALRQPTCGC